MDQMDGITISSPLIFLKDMRLNIYNWKLITDTLDVVQYYTTNTAQIAPNTTGEILV